ncbi:hypothetical protein EYF80_029695 [Liparis tanakae]|uniref:Uncharacterized protein n=1 Tax=Liparis tanakae TaxID=230148 RepID=A0A4Z2H4X8_9TELE|nr:hypothetical protein EYF80_029695 [Liparis tanakae]
MVTGPPDLLAGGMTGGARGCTPAERVRGADPLHAALSRLSLPPFSRHTCIRVAVGSKGSSRQFLMNLPLRRMFGTGAAPPALARSAAAHRWNRSLDASAMGLGPIYARNRSPNFIVCFEHESCGRLSSFSPADLKGQR